LISDEKETERDNEADQQGQRRRAGLTDERTASAKDEDKHQPRREKKRDERADAGCGGNSGCIEMGYNGVCHDGFTPAI
jgi:hypothetical protein